MAFHGRWWIHYPIDFINFSRKSVSRGPLSFNLTHALLKRPIALLDVTELRKRRDAATRMTPASANRLATILKAALNLAASTDERLSTRPWEIALAALPEATMADNVVLPEETIRQLVQAARTQSLKFGLLVKVLALTGARISQIRRWQVGDLVGQKKRASRTRCRSRQDLPTSCAWPLPAGR